jgi:serine protease inhibitor
MGVNAAAPQEMKEVILNRPFLFMIYDETNHVPVFIGTVNTPGDAQD